MILPWLAVAACTEPYTPELKELDRLVVVDGTLSDEPGPSLVRLSFSGDVYDPISLAEVFIVEQGGGRYALLEGTNGEYRTDSATFQAQIGQSYQLAIELEDGRRYESPFKTLLTNPGIDTIETEAQLRYFDAVQRDIPGYAFLISTNPAEGQNNFYVWEMEATYQYTADFLPYYILSDSLTPVSEANQYDYYTCWRDHDIAQKAAGSTQGFDQNKIVKKPLFFLPGNDRKLSRRYSLLVRQYAVDEQTYEFWDGVEGQSGTTTSLFNNQPYLIKGNMVNPQDSSEIVLGNFTVGSVKSLRVYVNTPTEFSVTYPDCIISSEGYQALFVPPIAQGTFFITLAPDSSLAISGSGCIDCRELSGTTTPPDWWEE
jgi:hypothetical protein